MKGRHFVKCREKGKGAWMFLTPRGTLSRLRVHAAEFDEAEAKAFAAANTADNPEWEFKVVSAERRHR